MPDGDRLYLLPKLLLLRAAIGLGLGGALGVAIQARSQAGGLPLQIRSPVRKHLPELFALALTVWLAVATAASATPLQALWGSHQRLQGLTTCACYIGLFLLISRFVNQPHSVRQILGAASVASIPVASLALLQQFGWQPFSVDPGYAGRSVSTFGSPNELGAYLAMVCPVTISLLLQPGTRRRLLWGGALLLDIAGLMATQSRSGWLGAAGAIRVLLLLTGRRAIVRWPPRGLFAGTVAGVSAVLIVAFGFLTGAFARLGTLFDLTSGTGAARLLIWRASVQALLARPLLGYGPDGLAPAFERYYPTSLLRFEGGWVQFDRAHNEFLDMGLVGGAPALLLYLVVIGWILVLGIRAARGRQTDHARLAAALVGGMAAYIVSTQFGFGTVGTMTQLWLFMALLLAVSRLDDPNFTSITKASFQFPRTSDGSGNHSFKSSNGRSSKRGRSGRAAFPALAGLLGVAGAIAGAVSLTPAMRADAAFQQAWDRTQRGDLNGLDGFAAAIELAPGDAHYYEGWAYALIDLARAGRQPAQAAGEKALQLLSSAIDLEPRNAPLYVQRGSAEAGLAELGEPGRLEAAELDFERAVNLAPRRAVYYEQWGQARLANGEASEATPFFKKAIALGLADSQLYQEYGQALQHSGRPAEAQRALAKARELKAKEIRDATSPMASNGPIL